MPTTTILPDWERTELLFKIIESAATTIAIIAGGLWAYFRFRRQRENVALIDFNVDIVYHAKVQNYWIVELIAYVENKGKVQHRIEKFFFELRSINSNDPVGLDPNHRNQVFFPNLIETNTFMPPRYTYFFIEPGLKNSYSYVARVPDTTEALLLHSWFEYLDGIHSHSAEITKKAP
jgi:hypothetical protein